jgi:hypothetical protein
MEGSKRQSHNRKTVHTVYDLVFEAADVVTELNGVLGQVSQNLTSDANSEHSDASSIIEEFGEELKKTCAGLTSVIELINKNSGRRLKSQPDGVQQAATRIVQDALNKLRLQVNNT